jgi:hypothetical protein
MRKNNGITIYDSTYKLGITRLSARIWDLKDAGFEIDEKWKEVKNRDGEKCKVKIYSLVSENHALEQRVSKL